MMKILNIYLVIALFMLSACSGAGSGLVAIDIENARGPNGVDLNAPIDGQSAQKVQAFNFNSLSELGALQVTEFKVTLTGDGLSEPLIATAGAEATQIEVLEIPAGPNRSILVEAFNSDGQVIRRRQLDGITIDPGVVSEVKLSLNTVPLILNMKDGAVVLSRSFRVVGFGEPATSIRIDTATGTDAINLNQSVPEGGMISPSRSTALFEAQPTTFLTGKQKITVTDENSNESSSITVFIIEGGGRPGTKFVTASDIDPLVTVGTGLSSERTGNFPAVIRALSQVQGGDSQ